MGPESPAPVPAVVPPAVTTPRTQLGVLAVGLTFLLPTIFLPSVAGPFWSPKYALLLVLAGASLPLLARPHPPHLRAAQRAGMALIAIAAISTFTSHNPILSLVGEWNWGTGLLFVIGIVGAWSLGAGVGPSQKVWVERALLGAAAANVLVMVLSSTINLHDVNLGRIDGRPVGLLGNPIHVASLVVAAFVLVLPRLQKRPWLWAVPVIVQGAAIEVLGGRFAALGAVVVLIAGYRALGWRTPALAAGLLTAGFMLGVSWSSTGPPTTGAAETVTLSSRATGAPGGAGGGSLAPRLKTWMTARHAVADRPVMGHGPGRFRSAVGPYRDASLTGADAREFVDAHNLAVEYVVTTGVVGLTAMLAFLFFALKQARGWLLGAALPLLAAHLVQPQSVGLTPILFLMLGVSAKPVTSALILPVAHRISAGFGAVAGVVAAAALLSGAFHLDQARLDFDVEVARAADRALGIWPEPALRLATLHQFRSITGEAGADLVADRWLAEAIRRDPSEARNWLRRGEYAASRGRLGAAARYYREALDRDPALHRARELLSQLPDSNR